MEKKKEKAGLLPASHRPTQGVINTLLGGCVGKIRLLKAQ